MVTQKTKSSCLREEIQARGTIWHKSQLLSPIHEQLVYSYSVQVWRDLTTTLLTAGLVQVNTDQETLLAARSIIVCYERQALQPSSLLNVVNRLIQLWPLKCQVQATTQENRSKILSQSESRSVRSTKTNKCNLRLKPSDLTKMIRYHRDQPLIKCQIPAKLRTLRIKLQAIKARLSETWSI